MLQRSHRASSGQLVIGIVLITVGLRALIAKLELPGWWFLSLSDCLQTWWPVSLIAAGIVWWIVARRGSTNGTSWEARHDI